MSAPPDFAIRAAVAAARRSPCAKSKRGAAVFQPEIPNFLFGVGWNGQPAPFVCTGDARCRATCGQRCVHAEVRAIRGLMPAIARGLELVHAKVIDGRLVAGGGPSCWQCSREILDAGLAAVWLYVQDTVVERNSQGFFPQPEEYPVGEPHWVRYAAEEFHHVTLRACGLEMP